MSGREDIKEKTRQIYEVLPHLDDQRCGYRNCGHFARAVAEGKAPCDGCIMGGNEVSARVCQVMGVPFGSSSWAKKDEGLPQFSTDSISNSGSGRTMGVRLGKTRHIRMGGRGMHAGHRKGRGRR